MSRTKRVAGAIVAAALTITVAACGGSSSGTTATTAGSTDSTGGSTDTTGDATATTGATESTGDATGTTAASCDPVTPASADPVPAADLKVGLTFDLAGRGDKSFNDSAAAGLDKAVADLGIPKPSEVTPTEESARGKDLQLQAENSNLVIGVGFSFAEAAKTVTAENPDVKFAIVDDPMMNFDCATPQPVAGNATGLVFAEEQGSYLVGVAAALKSKTGTIGFIGGVSGIGLIEKFEAGFVAGAKSVNPDIKINTAYITEFPDFNGFFDPARGKAIATGMFSEGADIIYSAAGSSGIGTFQAAKELTESGGDKVWGIGVDSDQYNTVDPGLQEYVLTSMLKRVDVAVYNVTQDVINGKFVPGEVRYDLAADGVGYSTSGGFVDDIVDQLEAAKKQIIDGEVEVPTVP